MSFIPRIYLRRNFSPILINTSSYTNRVNVNVSCSSIGLYFVSPDPVCTQISREKCRETFIIAVIVSSN